MKKYKIILITSFSRPWNDGWLYKAGFEHNGHHVVPMDSSSTLTRDHVFRVVKDVKPDFILHTKDELSPDIYQELKLHTKVIQWYPDPIIPDWLPSYVKSADIFFTMSEGLVAPLKEINQNVFWLTQAFEPSFFKINEITEKDKEAYSSDIVFVGNLGSKPQYLPRRKYLQSILEEGLHLKWWGDKIPRKFMTIPLLIGKIGRAYGGKFIYGEEFAKVARLAKIFLGFDSQPQVRKSMSERIYFALGCGSFYMCQHVDGIEDVFEPEREIVTFSSERDMIDKIKYYLEKDNLRMKIAQAGQRRVLKEHTYKIRIRQMIEIIEGTM